MTRIFVVGDIRLYREGLAYMLAREQRFCIVGAAGAREGILAGLRHARAEIVLLDMAMIGSLGVVRAIIQGTPGVKVVALAVAEAEDEIVLCAEAGIVGYVPREGSVEDLIATIESVARGEARCSPQIAAALLRRVAALSAERRAEGSGGKLTTRQLEIVRLIGEGLSNKEIARRLCIELSTVKNHVHSALEKLGTHRRAEAAALVRRGELSASPLGSLYRELNLRI
jgi:two-component system, NarL family, nitrate/nitrite response regulator NarL